MQLDIGRFTLNTPTAAGSASTLRSRIKILIARRRANFTVVLGTRLGMRDVGGFSNTAITDWPSRF